MFNSEKSSAFANKKSTIDVINKRAPGKLLCASSTRKCLKACDIYELRSILYDLNKCAYGTKDELIERIMYSYSIKYRLIHLGIMNIKLERVTKDELQVWRNVLKSWEQGIPLKYPKGRFHWNTSVLKNEGDVLFKHSFKLIENVKEQDYSMFKEDIEKSTNPYVASRVAFRNEGMIIIPMPVSGKNYATMNDFTENAPEIQRKEFWKKVAETAKQLMRERGEVWISIHGSIKYTNVKIGAIPMYYFDNGLIQNYK